MFSTNNDRVVHQMLTKNYAERDEKLREGLRDFFVEVNKIDKIRANLRNDVFDPDYMMSDIKIKIKYAVTTRSHDGYCSEPYDIVKSKKTTTRTYPLLKIFTAEDVDFEVGHDLFPSVLPDNLKLGFYALDYEQHGNGYCYMGTTYKIKSTKILTNKIPGETLLLLGNWPYESS